MSEGQVNNGLPSGWEVRMSNSRNLPYYFHSVSTTSSWEPPPGTNQEVLSEFMAANFSLPPPAAQGSNGNKIRAAHLLVKHNESRRPSSWRENKITRSKEEAIERLKAFEGRIRSGETTLGELAQTESDCSSARKNGDLGWFGPGEMQKEFEEASYALKPGEMSGVVESQSGVHLIERLA